MEKGDEIDKPDGNPPEKDDTSENPSSKNDVDEKTSEHGISDNQLIADITSTSSGNEIPPKFDIEETPSDNDISRAPPNGEITEAEGDAIDTEPKTNINENNKIEKDITSNSEETKTENAPAESPIETDPAETPSAETDTNSEAIQNETSSTESPTTIDMTEQSLNSDTDTVTSSPRNSKTTKTPPNSETEPDIHDDLPRPPPHFAKPTNFQIPATYFAGLHHHFEHYQLFVRMISGDIPLAPNIATKHEAELQASKRSHVINKQIDEMLAIIDADNKQYVRLLAMRAIMNLEDAKLVHKEGEAELAKQILWQTIQRSVRHVLEPEMTYSILRIMNHMAFYMIEEGNYSVPKDLMEQAEKIYLTLNYYESAQKKALVYFTEWELFSSSVEMQSTQESYEKSERLVTHNIELLAHIYYREGNDAMYSISQHRVLNRQLYMKDGDPLAWTRKCMNIGHFFIAKNQFSAARLHLAGATRILEEYVSEFHPDAHSVISLPAELVECCEAIAKSWVTYSIALFSDSRTQILETYYKGVHRDDANREAFIRSHMASTEADDLIAKFQSLFNALSEDKSVKKMFQDGCGDESDNEESDGSASEGRENRGQGEGAVFDDAGRTKKVNVKEDEDTSSEEAKTDRDEDTSEEEAKTEGDEDTSSEETKTEGDDDTSSEEAKAKGDEDTSSEETKTEADDDTSSEEAKAKGDEDTSEEEVKAERGEEKDKADREEVEDKESDVEKEKLKEDLDGIIVTREVHEKVEDRRELNGELRDGDIVVILKEDGVEVVVKGSKEDLEKKEGKGEDKEERRENGSGKSVGAEDGSQETDEDEGVDVGTDNEEKVDASSDDEKKVDASSGNEKKVDTSSDDEKKVDASSGDEKQVDTSSDDEKKVDTSSDDEKKVDASSGDEKKVDTSSDDEKKVDTSSDDEKKVDTSSDDEKKVDTSSDDEESSSSSEDKSVKMVREEGELEDDDDEEGDEGESDNGFGKKTESEHLSDKLFQFKLLMLNDILAEVPCSVIDNENDAHRLFNHAKNWLRRVIAYLDVTTNQDEYLNCVMELSELYRLVAFFETDPAERFYILSHRQNTLEIVTTVLRDVKTPSFVHLGVEMMRELTEVRLEMLELSRPGRSGKRFLHRKRAGMRYIHSRLVDTAAALGRDEIVARFLKQDPALFDAFEVPVGSEVPLPFQDN